MINDDQEAIAELEDALFRFLCKTVDIEKKLPRSMQDCVVGARWALRMTIGEELKNNGVLLRHPGARKGGRA